MTAVEGNLPLGQHADHAWFLILSSILIVRVFIDVWNGLNLLISIDFWNGLNVFISIDLWNGLNLLISIPCNLLGLGKHVVTKNDCAETQTSKNSLEKSLVLLPKRGFSEKEIHF
jgi:hypothetical protein